MVVSNIYYFHPLIWGRVPMWLIFFGWVGSTTNQIYIYICHHVDLNKPSKTHQPLNRPQQQIQEKIPLRKQLPQLKVDENYCVHLHAEVHGLPWDTSRHHFEGLDFSQPLKTFVFRLAEGPPLLFDQRLLTARSEYFQMLGGLSRYKCSVSAFRQLAFVSSVFFVGKYPWSSLIHAYPYWQIHEEIVGVSGHVRQGGRTAVSA